MGRAFSKDGKLVCLDINKEFVIQIKNKYNIKTFVETGTYSCKTIIEMNDYFDKLYTIEASKYFFDLYIKKNIDIYPKIRFINDTSENYLSTIIDTFESMTIFYLDSHFMSEEGFGANIKHPLLNELNIICNNKNNVQHILILDDFSFISKPCGLNRIDEWPSIDQIVNIVCKKYDYYISIINDAIFCVPRECKVMFTDPKVYGYYDNILYL